MREMKRASATSDAPQKDFTNNTSTTIDSIPQACQKINSKNPTDEQILAAIGGKIRVGRAENGADPIFDVCLELAKYTDDPDQIERLILDSKTNLNGHANDLTEMTQQAVEMQPKMYQIETQAHNILLREGWGADDEGNAQAVNQLYAGSFLCCSALGWLFYNGRYWEREEAESQLRLAIIDTLKQRRHQAVDAGIESIIKATKPTATNVRNCKYILEAMLTVSVSDFDANPDELNCYNGVVNLKTGELTPHSPDQKFTYCLRTAYDPNADSSDWARWLYEAITPENLWDTEEGDTYLNKVDYIRRAIGYSITGRTVEEVMFYLYGENGRNGKGLLLHIVSDMLGRPLSSGVDFDALTTKRTGNDQKFDLAPLKPSRLVTASESEQASRLNSKTVKAITGNDVIRCAHKHGAFFEYTPQFKIWLASNFEISADADDEALWTRIRVIVFPNSWIGNEDPGLEGKLRSNMEGILAWTISGAIDWYKMIDDGKLLKNEPIYRDTTNSQRSMNDSVQAVAPHENVVSGKN